MAPPKTVPKPLFVWSVNQPLLPNVPRGLPRVDDRPMLSGIFLGSSHWCSMARGGLTTKVHVLSDARGLPVKPVLTEGQAADCPVAGKLDTRINLAGLRL